MRKIVVASAFAFLAVPVASADESKSHKEAVSYPVMWVTKSHKEAFAQPMAEAAPPAAVVARLEHVGLRAVDQPITPSGGAPTTAPRVGTKLGDEEILQVAHVTNEREIQQARLAQSRAEDPRVRALADDIVSRHVEAERRQTQLQQQRSITPVESPTSEKLLAEGQDQLDVLSEKTGAEFDRAYLAGQVKGQREVLDVIDKQLAPSASDGEVKRLVNELRPAVRDHLRTAKSLQQKVKE